MLYSDITDEREKKHLIDDFVFLSDITNPVPTTKNPIDWWFAVLKLAIPTCLSWTLNSELNP